MNHESFAPDSGRWLCGFSGSMAVSPNLLLSCMVVFDAEPCAGCCAPTLLCSGEFSQASCFKAPVFISGLWFPSAPIQLFSPEFPGCSLTMLALGGISSQLNWKGKWLEADSGLLLAASTACWGKLLAEPYRIYEAPPNQTEICFDPTVDVSMLICYGLYHKFVIITRWNQNTSQLNST